MTVFIAEMSSRYDYLLFDLPSVNVSADAAIISQMVDGVLFVSKPGLLDEFNASKAQSLLVKANANLLGMILNGSNDPRDAFLPQDGDEIEEEFQEDWLDLADDPGDEEPDFSNLGRAQLQLSGGKISRLDQQSLPELEHQLEELQAQWAASKRLLDSKEEELIHLCHVRKEFEIELNQMSLSLATTDNRGPQLEALNEKIRKTDARREYLLRNIKSLREQIKVEQNTFYAHLKVLQSQHSQAALMGDPPIT